MIGYLLISVAALQHPQQIPIDAGYLSPDAREDCPNAAVCLGNLAGAVDDEGFSGTKRCVVDRASCHPREIVADGSLRVIEFDAGSLEVGLGLGTYRSTPSRRNSCISPVRSRYDPAVSGKALMTAPVSQSRSVPMSTSAVNSSLKSR